MNPARASAFVLVLLLAACRVTDPDLPGDLPVRGHPQFTFLVGGSAGDLAHATDGTTADGEVEATTWRAMLEGRSAKSDVGFGLEGFVHVSEEGLFGAGNGAKEQVTDAFAYLYFLTGGGDSFSMPIRIGGTYQEVELDEPSGGSAADVTWESWGGRIAFEPEVRLLYAEEFCWSVFASGYYGRSAADVEVAGVSRKFDATSYHAGGEIGMRWEFGRLLLGVSWIDRRIDVDRTEASAGSTVPGIDSEFEGLMFTGGLRF